MNQARLQQLRRKQLILINGTTAIAIGTFALLLYIVPLSFSTLYRVIAIVSLCSVLFSLINHKKRDWWFKFLPSMRELYEYEELKLGKQQAMFRKSTVIVPFLQALLFFWLSFQFPSDFVLDISGMGSFLLITMLVLLLMINLSLFRHIKRVDQQTSEELRHFFVKSWIFSIVLGLSTCVLMFVLILFWVVPI